MGLAPLNHLDLWPASEQFLGAWPLTYGLTTVAAQPTASARVTPPCESVFQSVPHFSHVCLPQYNYIYKYVFMTSMAANECNKANTTGICMHSDFV